MAILPEWDVEASRVDTLILPPAFFDVSQRAIPLESGSHERNADDCVRKGGNGPSLLAEEDEGINRHQRCAALMSDVNNNPTFDARRCPISRIRDPMTHRDDGYGLADIERKTAITPKVMRRIGRKDEIFKPFFPDTFEGFNIIQFSRDARRAVNGFTYHWRSTKLEETCLIRRGSLGA